MTDLIVAGGGPVGLVAAITAVRAGLDVVVVEPRRGTVDKACGEGLMPGALSRLAALGVDPPGMDLAGIRYLSGDRRAVARFSCGPGRGVRRTVLHEHLLTMARDLGVRTQQGRVAEVRQTSAGVDAAGLRAGYLIGADGLHSAVRQAVGAGSARGAARRYGVRQHFAGVPATDLVDVYWLPDVEVYVTPVAADVVGVAVLGGRPLSVPAAVARVPALAAALARATPTGPVRGAGPFPQVALARAVGRVLLVGDAAGYVDPLTGEGLRMGFAQAQAAIDAIVAGRPQAYEAEWRRITRSYRTITGTLLWVGARPRLRPTVVPMARTFPRTFRRVVDGIAG